LGDKMMTWPHVASLLSRIIKKSASIEQKVSGIEAYR
jgi:hypothetical protein